MTIEHILPGKLDLPHPLDSTQNICTNKAGRTAMTTTRQAPVMEPCSLYVSQLSVYHIIDTYNWNGINGKLESSTYLPM